MYHIGWSEWWKSAIKRASVSVGLAECTGQLHMDWSVLVYINVVDIMMMAGPAFVATPLFGLIPHGGTTSLLAEPNIW